MTNGANAMSTTPDKPNVVDLQQRQAQATPADRIGDLLKLVRSISIKRINALVGTLFENVDDALFDLAERAGSNSIQIEYFDGMREVRKKRQLVERLFQEQTTQAFADFADGKSRPTKPESAPQATGGLALVDDIELEESLAVSSMVAKADSRLQRPLYQLNQRLAVIIGGSKVEAADNPIGPTLLGQAFRSAIHEFDINLQVKLIIYKLFDRYVMTGLDSVYDEINVELVRAGVLPQVRHTLPHGSRPALDIDSVPHRYAGAAAESDPNAPHDGAYGRNADDYEGNAAALQSELYRTLRSLLAHRHGEPSGGGYPDGIQPGTPGYGMPGLSPSELLNALTILQGQTVSVQQAKAASAADAARAVQQIKRELIEQVQKLSDDARERRVSTADEDTIDLVGMLFEYILQDRNLPAQMQALLGRLQIPYLKVAILDKHLFAQRSHPARRLLDVLAEAGKGWTEESDRDGSLHERVRATVETVLRDFDDDVGVFERELATFTAFMAQHQKRAVLAEQRAADATRGREKLQEARRSAAHEILKRIDQRDLPPIVHTVLSRPWANYLVLTLLRQGEGSDEWKSALRFADEFVWSSQPKTTPADHARLRALLPQLEKALRHGLAAVAYHESDVKELMQELGQFYRRVLDGQRIETKSAKEVIEENRPLVADSAAAQPGDSQPSLTATPQSPVEEIVLGETPVEPPPSVSAIDDDDEFVKAVRDLKVGTWIEFVEEEDHRERAKLSWISPISSKYLFVNRRGLKVCDKTVAALAGELRTGTAIVLEEVPLFDRALDAIVARLRHTAEPNPATGSGDARSEAAPESD